MCAVRSPDGFVGRWLDAEEDVSLEASFGREELEAMFPYV